MNLKHKGIIDIFTKLGKMYFAIWLSGIRGEGVMISLYNIGVIREISTYKNNRRNGISKLWYSNGQLFSRCSYKDERVDGEAKSWSLSGKLERHAIYKNDKVIKEFL